MASFNSEIDQLFPQTECFRDFSGTVRKFDFYIRELSLDDYTIVAQDVHNHECRFEAYLNANPRKELALLKMEIVQYLGAPCSNACSNSINQGAAEQWRNTRISTPSPRTRTK
jgi:hypothetical protein